MDTLNSSLSEEILYIPDEPAPKRRAWSRGRVAGWIGFVAVAGLVTVPLVMAVDHSDPRVAARAMRCPAQTDRPGFP